jgi:hypothetical protein
MQELLHTAAMFSKLLHAIRIHQAEPGERTQLSKTLMLPTHDTRFDSQLRDTTEYFIQAWGCCQQIRNRPAMNIHSMRPSVIEEQHMLAEPTLRTPHSACHAASG